MTESVSKAPFAGLKRESEEIAALLLSHAGPSLYAANPFRVLGVSVQDGNREIIKRSDKLKITAELGGAEAAPCLSPSRPSLELCRESVRELSDPRIRFLREFFWFWPDKYPEDVKDASLVAIAERRREDAVSTWCSRLASNSAASLHNLAIYFHCLVIDWEAKDVDAPLSEILVWRAAVKYWKAVIASDEIWEMLGQRSRAGENASILANAAAELRQSLPDLLAKTGADLTIKAALRGNLERAKALAELAQSFHANPEDARRVHLLALEPLTTKLKLRQDQFRQRAKQSPKQLLEAVRSFLQESEGDLDIIRVFCGDSTERFREFNQSVSTDVLEVLVAYQRATKDDLGCLPYFIHLQDRALTPELAARAGKAFEVMQENALAGIKARHRHGKVYELILNNLLPADQLFSFRLSSQQAYRKRLATMLRSLAEAASPASLGKDAAENALKLSDELVALPA
jgi:hypothetical protein